MGQQARKGRRIIERSKQYADPSFDASLARYGEIEKLSDLPTGERVQRVRFTINADNFFDLGSANNGYGVMVLNEVNYPDGYVEIAGTPVFYSNGEDFLSSGSISVGNMALYTGWGGYGSILKGMYEGIDTTMLKSLDPLIFKEDPKADLVGVPTFYRGLRHEDSPGVYNAASIFLYSLIVHENVVINPAWKGYVEFDAVVRFPRYYE
jgi:hypothetical protein